MLSIYPGVDTYNMGWTWGIGTYAKVGEEWGALMGTGFDRITQSDIEAGTASADQLGAIKVSARGLSRTKGSQILGHVSPKALMGWRQDFYEGGKVRDAGCQWQVGGEHHRDRCPDLV
ncbi:MAG: hypothetical protein ACI30I_03795 [Parabacteroides sp.]